MLLHLEDLEFGASNGGRIWLTIGEQAFPDEGWYDLPGILLETWMPGLNSFFLGNSDSCELQFMDGPYEVRLHRAEERVTAVFWEQNRAAIPETEIDLPVFWHSVKKCVRYYERMKYLSTK